MFASNNKPHTLWVPGHSDDGRRLGEGRGHFQQSCSARVPDGYLHAVTVKETVRPPGLSAHAGPAHGREETPLLISDTRMSRAPGACVSSKVWLHVFSFS